MRRRKRRSLGMLVRFTPERQETGGGPLAARATSPPCAVTAVVRVSHNQRPDVPTEPGHGVQRGRRQLVLPVCERSRMPALSPTEERFDDHEGSDRDVPAGFELRTTVSLAAPPDTGTRRRPEAPGHGGYPTRLSGPDTNHSAFWTKPHLQPLLFYVEGPI
jgi:hypothetical protein